MAILGVSGQFVLVALVSIFTIVNPLGATSLFLAHTSSLSDAGVDRVARRASIASALVLIFFALTGATLFRLLGITIPSFRIAGGILLFMVALDMLKGENVRSRTLPEDQQEALEKDDISLIPLAIPLLSGPGAITAVIVLMTRAKSVAADSVVILSILVTAFVTYLVLIKAPILLRIFKPSGVRVMNRLNGLLLAGISIQFVIDGIKELVPEFSKIIGHLPG